MIVKPQREGRPELRFLNTHTGAHPFRVLRQEKGSTISDWDCMECDGGATLTWERGSNRFVLR